MFRIRKKSEDVVAEPEPEPEPWRAPLPTNDLDRLMWGSEGVPPPASPVRTDPRYQRDWAASDEDAGRGAAAEGDAAHGGESGAGDDGDKDNIVAALDVAAQERPPPPAAPPPPPPPDDDDDLAPPDDEIVLEDIVWKQRSGFGKYSGGLLQHEWEQRRVVLFASGILRYYVLRRDMEGVTFDPRRAADPSKSPWVYDPAQKPRGEIDLRNREGEDGGGDHRPSSFDKGMRRLASLGKGDKDASNVGGVKVQARQRQSNPGPTPFEIDITRKDNNKAWRFCFLSQSIQIEWLSTLKLMAASGDEEDDSHDSDDDGTEGLANHGFQPGDHIIRWEMLPVLYPIQVHGIVLEAGKNAVIIADFGLASYDNRSESGDLTTWSDEGEEASHDVILAAWERIKPREKKRLNVRVVTDRKEVRRWSKIDYGDQVEKDSSKKAFFKSLLPWEKKSGKKTDPTKIDEMEDETEEHDSEVGDASCIEADADKANSPAEDAPHAGGSQNGAIDAPPVAHEEFHTVEGEPEWAQPGYRPRKRTGSSSSATPCAEEGQQSVFSVDHPDDHPRNELPKSDSAKLVLARTHFVLENEDLLPPYHVFYSNSECIAVWCKTGRWSTLQAAVYLVSSSLGFGKSATMITVSVAAAHVVLLPALAVGGLAVMGAPLLYLKKSQEKWDRATRILTHEFWSRAPPEVFVEAIEYWGSRGGATR